MAKIATVIAQTVDEYLSAVPAPQRALLQKVRQAIRAAAPKAEELISYQVPTYKYKGPLVVFAAFPKHCSLIVISPTILKMFAEELAEFKTAGRTIHFSPEHPLPLSLVKKIVKVRLKENEERVAAKEMVAGSKKKEKW